MANLCSFCLRKWPPEPVKLIILGDDWFECCSECFEAGEGEFENKQTGEKVTFKELWKILEEKKNE